MDNQKTSIEADIKKWAKPEIKELDISDTQFGGGQTEDGDGFGEAPIDS